MQMGNSGNHGRQERDNELVISYLEMRKAIGFMGFFIPTAMLLYALLTGDPLRSSISSYYYSPMREVFVGGLLAIAVFMWSYRGYREPGRLITDRLVARCAAVAITLGSLSPTDPPRVEAGLQPAATAGPGNGGALECLLNNGPTADHPSVDYNLMQCLLGPELGPRLHIAAAAVFLLALAVFCLVLFVRDDSPPEATAPEKQAEHRIYRICGWIIIASMALIAFLWLTDLDVALAALRPVFWLEALACFAFATSWLIKGRTMRPVVRMMARRL
ncbi:hypothetical protein SAMN04487972_11394 [Paracoccus halophilus]|uniref:DUF998 domain-containing protein n=1 Tax=Paracoccus halophilus TaxID=376733 RepID=A0A1I0TUR0_9RHOB|nr:hypothetical protein SAMN04487972_11394 [Paracoccus halophilus]